MTEKNVHQKSLSLLLIWPGVLKLSKRSITRLMSSLLQIVSKESMVFKINYVIGVEIPPNILLTWFVGGRGGLYVEKFQLI